MLNAVLLVMSTMVAAEAPNTLSQAERKAGWELLFDGKSLDGWRNYQADGVSSGWKVKDGTLVRAERGAGDIVTDKQYDLRRQLDELERAG